MFLPNRRWDGKTIGVRRISDEMQIPLNAMDNPYWREFLAWNAQQPTPLDLSDKPPDPPTVEAARDAKLTPKAIAAAFLLLRELRGGAAAPQWAKTLATDVLTAIDAAGNS
jgi:hypothetical protein